MAMNCDYCSNYIYDEEDDCYYCDVNLDEDCLLYTSPSPRDA